jgi:hypothetical protein
VRPPCTSGVGGPQFCTIPVFDGQYQQGTYSSVLVDSVPDPVVVLYSGTVSTVLYCMISDRSFMLWDVMCVVVRWASRGRGGGFDWY